MNNDLKNIKKHYGEKMMHLCRELFSTILDNSPGLLSTIILETFAPNHFLYDDLFNMSYVSIFKKYIYNIYEKFITETSPIKIHVADPKTLMRQAGYTLYECLTEDDIQKFKKYYARGEALCTFNGDRLKYCYVYFAVKDNADKLNRQDFLHPDRQDEYGTSVISIQFSRDDSHILSIKNRYNHTVQNPDATFGNDLDNIVPGLTTSFAEYYGMEQTYNHTINYFDLHGYVRANNGKYYKYNFELNNKYFCPNNIVIDNFQVFEYPRELYLVTDYFLLDLVNKKITSLLPDDSFANTINDISKINITNNGFGKTVTITPSIGEDIIIELDKYQRIIGYKNNNVTVIGPNFLRHNTELINLSLDNVTSISHDFLTINHTLKEISLPNTLIVGDNFLPRSSVINVSLPQVKSIGSYFLSSNYAITSIELPKVETIGPIFLGYNWSLRNINLPNLYKLGSHSLSHVSMLANLHAPKLKIFSPSDNRLTLLLGANKYMQSKDDSYKKIKK